MVFPDALVVPTDSTIQRWRSGIVLQKVRSRIFPPIHVVPMLKAYLGQRGDGVSGDDPNAITGAVRDAAGRYGCDSRGHLYI